MRTLVAVIGIVLIAAVPTSASLQLNSGSDQGAIPTPPNNFHSQLTSATLGLSRINAGTLTALSAGTVEFFYHGQESAWDNSFLFNGTTLLSSAGNGTHTEVQPASNTTWNGPGELIGTFNIPAGLLDLAFDSDNHVVGGLDVLHPIGTGEFGIFVTSTGSIFANDGRVYFGHDGNGAGPDVTMTT